MLNSVKKGLGYREIIYNIKTGKFFTYEVGDQFQDLPISADIESGNTINRPTNPDLGQLYWDTDLGSLIVWNGSAWEPVGAGSGVNVPSGDSASRPANPETGALYWDTTINSLLVYDGANWVPATPDDVAVLSELVLQDKVTSAEVIISVRDGALVVTNPFNESVSQIDLGGTTPDPGTLSNVFH